MAGVRDGPLDTGAAGARRRFALHQRGHAHAVQMSREGIPLLLIQPQLGHADPGITSGYLRGIDNTEIVQRNPRRIVSSGLRRCHGARQAILAKVG